MSLPDHPVQTTREWITGLVVLAATIVGVFGFVHLSYMATMIVAVTLLGGLLLFFWTVGVRKRRGRNRPRG